MVSIFNYITERRLCLVLKVYRTKINRIEDLIFENNEWQNQGRTNKLGSYIGKNNKVWLIKYT